MTKLIIDTNSLVDLFKHYEKIKNFQVITDLIRADITSGQIIIIDKVYEELLKWHGKNDGPIKKLNLTPKDCTNTEHLIPKLTIAAPRWIKKEIETNTPKERLEVERRRFFEEYADLRLIIFCKEQHNKDLILVTEESPKEKENKKLYQKIPTMCNTEGITYEPITNILFDFYKEKLIVSAVKK